MKKLAFFWYLACVLVITPVQWSCAQPWVHEKSRAQKSSSENKNVPEANQNKFEQSKVDQQKIQQPKKTPQLTWKKIGLYLAGTAAVLGSIYYSYVQLMQQSRSSSASHKYPLGPGVTPAQQLGFEVFNSQDLPEIDSNVKRIAKTYQGMDRFIASPEGQQIIKTRKVKIVKSLQATLNHIYDHQKTYPLFDDTDYMRGLESKIKYRSVPLAPIELITPYSEGRDFPSDQIKITLDAYNSEGDNAIMHAIVALNGQLLDDLLQNGAKLSTDKFGQTPVTLLLSRPEESLGHGYTMEKVLRKLLSKNQTLAYTPDRYGNTPLMYATMFDRSQNVMETLLENGANPNETNNYNRAALQLAGAQGRSNLELALNKRKNIQLRQPY